MRYGVDVGRGRTRKGDYGKRGRSSTVDAPHLQHASLAGNVSWYLPQKKGHGTEDE